MNGTSKFIVADLIKIIIFDDNDRNNILSLFFFAEEYPGK